MKANEKLWKNRANQLLQRNDIAEEASNVEDTDSPDGAGTNDIHDRKNNRDPEQTWYQHAHRSHRFNYWIGALANGQTDKQKTPSLNQKKRHGTTTKDSISLYSNSSIDMSSNVTISLKIIFIYVFFFGIGARKFSHTNVKTNQVENAIFFSFQN